MRRVSRRVLPAQGIISSPISVEPISVTTEPGVPNEPVGSDERGWDVEGN